LNIRSASINLTLMSTYKPPIFASSLDDLPWVLKHLDRRYGTHGIEDARKKKGGYYLRFILKHLASNRESTCEEIAQEVLNENLQWQRKIKSITDEVRKVVKNVLINSQLVYEGEPKKIYNKYVKTYCLSPVGIMYVIHLFGKVIENKNRSYDFEKIDVEFIKSLRKEYSQTIPKIFERFKLFEKVLGKDFDYVLIYSLIPVFRPGISDFYDSRELLSNYVLRYFWATNPMKIKTGHGLIAEQISLIFYIHLKESIEGCFYSKDYYSDQNLLLKLSRENKFEEYDKKKKTKESQQYGKMAKEKWLQIMNEDKEIKKWYKNFLDEAAKSKKEEYDAIAMYKKEGLSKNYPL